jgi:hypothetical protein
VRARYQPSYVEKLDRDRPPPVDAGAIIRFASVGEIEARAGALDLEVADGALRIDCGEASTGFSRCLESGDMSAVLTESFLGLMSFEGVEWRGRPSTNQLWRTHRSDCSGWYSCQRMACQLVLSADHVPCCSRWSGRLQV